MRAPTRSTRLPVNGTQLIMLKIIQHVGSLAKDSEYSKLRGPPQGRHVSLPQSLNELMTQDIFNPRNVELVKDVFLV